MIFNVRPSIFHKLGFACLSFVLFFMASPKADMWQAGNMRFEHLLMDGDSSNSDIGSIRAMTQDAVGFIWIGAEYGLARYDGTHAVRYAADPADERSLSSNYINDLLVDDKGVMWVATDRGLHRYNRLQDDFSRVELEGVLEPQGRVTGLALESAGRIVIGQDAGASLYEPSTGKLLHYPLPYGELKVPASINSVFVDQQDRIWVATRGVGAGLLDEPSGRYQFFSHSPDDPASIIDNHITTIAEDRQGRLWFGSHSSGVSRMDPATRQFTHFRHDLDDPEGLGSDLIWDIRTDSQGLIWIATDHGGISVYQPESDNFVHVRNRPFDLSSLSSNQVRTIFEDARGDMWFGLFPAGLDYYNRAATQFRNFAHRPDRSNSLSHSAVLSLLEGRDGLLWVGTEGGLNAFDREAQRFTRYTRSTGADGLSADAVLALTEDDQGHLWIGTWSGGVNRLNRSTQKFDQFRPRAGDSGSLSSGIVWSIVNDRQGRIWLGTEGGGLNLFHPEDSSFSHWLHDPKDPSSISSNFIWTMLEDSQGRLWIGTTAGLNLFDPHSRSFRNLGISAEDQQTLANNRVRGLMEDRRGRIWIGSQDNGLFVLDPENNTLAHYGADTGLPALYVTGFREDTDGFVWATTTRGVVLIEPVSMAMRVFNRNHGLIGHNFNREASSIDAEGRIYLGSTEGLSVFQPRQLHITGAESPLLITGMRVLNQPVVVGADKAPLKRPIWQTQQLSLDHQQAMFSFEFSKLDYRNRNNRNYAYKLEGFDRDWNSVGGNNTATFTNLNPGRYIFRVRAGSNDGWDATEQQLIVQVLPPPWRSAWAYIGYLLAVLVVLALFIGALVKHYQLTSQQQTNQELVKLNELKDAFLANTSHELRTPLNGIIGIADALADHLQSDPFAATRLQLIASSGRRLGNLINDILDYSKLTKQNLALEVKPLDMKRLTDSVFTLLAPLKADKPLRLVNRIAADALPVLADENRLQQILINLVGNGIKYTEKGEVTVGVRTDGEYAVVYIEDTGMGIAPEQQHSVFEAFHQVQHSSTRQFGGTGLGLAITKQLVELHGGSIWLEVPRTGGTRVAFRLRLGKAEQKSKAAADDHPQAPERLDPAPASAPKISAKPAEPAKGPRNARDQTILVVDDDVVNRMVLRGHLEYNHYQVLEADSGPAAISTLRANAQVDLVIMDVMMPHMSGFEACEIIRASHPSHQLPILFLTAKSNTDKDLATCFSVGGNDFFSKPVAKDDLLPRVANHLRIQAIIRQLQFDLERARFRNGHPPQGAAGPVSHESR